MGMFARGPAFAAITSLGTLSRAHATDFSGTIFFGDSLTDSGTYKSVVPPGGGTFTTNPGPVGQRTWRPLSGRPRLPR